MDFLIYLGVILVLSFIISTFKYISYRTKLSKEIRREYAKQHVISNTTWACPRCDSRVSNELNRCSCGQPIHNSGRK